LRGASGAEAWLLQPDSAKAAAMTRVSGTTFNKRAGCDMATILLNIVMVD
jgi:hypothetical protein